MDMHALGLIELSANEQTLIDGGADGYEWGLAVGRFLRAVGEALTEQLAKTPRMTGDYVG